MLELCSFVFEDTASEYLEIQGIVVTSLVYRLLSFLTYCKVFSA